MDASPIILTIGLDTYTRRTGRFPARSMVRPFFQSGAVGDNNI